MIRRALLIAVAICATSAHAAERLSVISPAGGTILRGGHFYTLAWTAGSLPARAEEWEAFASVDGGRYYCARLTPHLDINVRRFDVLIPNIDSDDFRLLIRTGDERQETIIELPQRFRIRADATADLASALTPAAVAPESARPGERPVVLWSSGDRSGACVRNEVAAKPQQIDARATERPDDETTASFSQVPATLALLEDSAAVPTREVAAAQHSTAAAPDVLLLSTRMNV